MCDWRCVAQVDSVVWLVLVDLQVLALRFVWYFDVPFLGCLAGVGGALFGFGWCMDCAGYGDSFWCLLVLAGRL